MKVTTEIYKEDPPAIVLWYGMDDNTGFEDSTLRHVLQPQGRNDWRLLMATMSGNAITIRPFPDEVYKKISKILNDYWKKQGGD